MCFPDEGPRLTETSHFVIKSLELKCHAYIFCLTHGTHIYSLPFIIYIYICVCVFCLYIIQYAHTFMRYI